MKTPIDKNRATEEEPNPIRGKTINTETIATAGKGEPELAEIVENADGEPELSLFLVMKQSGNYGPSGTKFKQAS
jgi:hypothetical protein